MKRWKILPKAQADLDEIWNYTEAQWGLEQAEAYSRSIQDAIERLLSDQVQGRAFDRRRGYFRYGVHSHIVFYRFQQENIEVVRILHQRMDFDRHL